MKKSWLLGMLSGIVLVVVSVLLFVVSGAMPVATKGKPLPLERTITGWALNAALRGEKERPSPLPANTENLLAGAQIYTQHCSICHGLPAQDHSAISKGLFPPPPQFFKKDEGVIDDPPSKIHWFVKNGIRLTGMPGFVDNLSESELWQVSMFLHQTDDLPSSVKDFLNSVKKRN